MSSNLDPAAVDLLDFASIEACAYSGTLDLVIAAWTPRLAVPSVRCASPVFSGVERQGDPAARARLATFRAIRLDLPLFVRDPSLVFQCLYNRLVWVEDPAAAAFYGEKAEFPLGEPLLRGLLERFRAHRRATGVAGCWVRSLRPPVYELGSSLVEEYREALPFGELRFSGDGSAIGVIGGRGSMAWDRRTGRCLDDEGIARLFTPTTRPDPLWLGAITASAVSGASVDLGLRHDSSLDVRAKLPDGDLIVARWKVDDDGDDEGVVLRIDASYRARWGTRIASRIFTISPCSSGHLLAVEGHNGLTFIDAATGDPTARIPPDRSAVITLDPSGSWAATRKHDQIQVWDLAEVGTPPGRVLRRGNAGFVDAQMSPDGRRLLTGELLCDAADGHVIAHLHLDGPGYLEGGPPSTGRLLANDRFVEMSPIGGVCVWETDRGERLIHDQTRRYGAMDIIVIAPDGLSYVHARRPSYRRPGSVLELRRTDNGQALAQLAIQDPTCVRFSPDGSRVIAGSANGELYAWSAPEGKEVLRLRTGSAEVTEIVISVDGTKFVTAGLDGVLRLWSAAGDSLAERAFTPATGDSDVPWGAMPENLESIDGWLGFCAIPHSLSARRRHGLLEIVDRRSGEVCARVVASEGLRSDPSGRCWAHRSMHVVLEDDRDAKGESTSAHRTTPPDTIRE